MSGRCDKMAERSMARAILRSASLPLFQNEWVRHDEENPAAYRTLCRQILAGEVRFEACHTVMLSMGGMGYVKEYHVER